MAIKTKKPSARTAPTKKFAFRKKGSAAPPAEDAPAAKQESLLTESDAPAKKPTSMEFQSNDEAMSVALALSGRAEDLTAEAKRLTGLGRHVEARNLLREAKHIDETLLPQVRTQTSMPFNTAESLPAAVTRTVGQTVRSAVVRAMKNNIQVGEGETADAVLEQRKTELADFERVIGTSPNRQRPR